jgi:hypothetical protein
MVRPSHFAVSPDPGRRASASAFGEGLKLFAEMIMATPPEDIGRMMSGVETAELIRRLVQGRGRPWP